MMKFAEADFTLENIPRFDFIIEIISDESVFLRLPDGDLDIRGIAARLTGCA